MKIERLRPFQWPVLIFFPSRRTITLSAPSCQSMVPTTSASTLQQTPALFWRRSQRPLNWSKQWKVPWELESHTRNWCQTALTTKNIWNATLSNRAKKLPNLSDVSKIYKKILSQISKLTRLTSWPQPPALLNRLWKQRKRRSAKKRVSQKRTLHFIQPTPSQQLVTRLTQQMSLRLHRRYLWRTLSKTTIAPLQSRSHAIKELGKPESKQNFSWATSTCTRESGSKRSSRNSLSLPVSPNLNSTNGFGIDKRRRKNQLRPRKSPIQDSSSPSRTQRVAKTWLHRSKSCSRSKLSSKSKRWRESRENKPHAYDGYKGITECLRE